MRIILIILAIVVAALLGGFGWTYWQTQRVEADHQPEGHMVLVAGGRLHVVDAGPRDAPPERTLVLLHGASTNHLDMMLALGDRLKERYRIIAPDRPGHGWSERPDGQADGWPIRQAALIAEALDKLGIKGAIFVAHSWSGPLAIDLALNRPDLVGGLVLLAPVTHPWPGGGIAWYYKAATNPWLGGVFNNAIVAPVANFVMGSAIDEVFAPQQPPQGYEQATGARLLLRPAEFRANAEDLGELWSFVHRLSRDYPAIKTPLTIIAGDADRIVSTPIHAVALAKEVPGAKLVILPGVGHMPHHVAADRVIGEIDAMSERLQKPDTHALN